MVIDPKYTTRSLAVLTDKEKLREINQPKVDISIDLFKDDFEQAKSLNLNISRIIRFKFHEWLLEKIQIKE
jgi:hypothetical protein